MNGRHDEHDAIVEFVDGFDHNSFDAMGYRAERRELATFWNIDLIRTAGFDASRIEDLLDEGRHEFDGRPFAIEVSGRRSNDELAPGLVRAGCVPDDDVNLSLAHVGPVPDLPVTPGVRFEAVDEGNVVGAATAKLQAFADSEATPDAERLAFDLRLRRAEIDGVGAGHVAVTSEEIASVLFCFDDPAWNDVIVFLLGTRVPFRGRRLGERLLVERIRRVRESGRRSTVINVFASNVGALRLYERLGFTDVVASRRTYRYDPR